MCLLLSLVLLASGSVAIVNAAHAVDPPPSAGPPLEPPARICGQSRLLDGPPQPAGSVRVDPGTSLATITQENPPGTTFWLAPGTHTLGSNPNDQVIPKRGDIYVGAAGAVIDGQGINRAAFAGGAPDVQLRYLTVQNFSAPDNEAAINQSGAASWVVEFSTVRNNTGVGVLLGDNNVLRYSCVTANGQYGLTAFTPDGTQNIVIDHIELSSNALGAYAQTCGCSGGTKLWNVTGATITNNWVHHNRNQGLWADTNAVGFRIEGNYISDNEAEGIFYEASYNAYIHNNTLKRNALVKGRVFADRNDTFPVAPIYISESGGDPRLFGGQYATLEISGNLLEDNWGGVVLWEDPNRFCNTASPATGYCPIAGAASPEVCVEGSIEFEPYLSDCRWRTRNVWVHDNDFSIDKVALQCVGTQCGQQGLFSTTGVSPPWSPYKGNVIQEWITFHQNNVFSGNRYFGDWHFDVYAQGRVVDFATWQARPYSQDRGSTMTQASGTSTTTTSSTSTTSTTAPVRMGNLLDADSSGLEGSIGRWAPWYSSTVARTSAQAHSGTQSLHVVATGSSGWGVVADNWPGFAATPGTKTLRFWGRSDVSGPDARFRVRWRDAGGSDLQTDSVAIPALGTTWQQAVDTVTAPSGTARVAVELVGGPSAAGSSLYFDDFVIEAVASSTTTTTRAPTTTTSTTTPTTTTTTAAPAPVTGNALDADTAGLEGSIGRWVPWYGSSVGRSTAAGHTGTSSLEVTLTGSSGWGVSLANWPGFAATPGTKMIGFWGRSGTDSGLGVTMRVKWRDAAGSDLKVDVVTLSRLESSWQQATATVAAPAGTTRVWVELVGGGASGNTLYLDDLTVGDVGT